MSLSLSFRSWQVHCFHLVVVVVGSSQLKVINRGLSLIVGSHTIKALIPLIVQLNFFCSDSSSSTLFRIYFPFAAHIHSTLAYRFIISLARCHCEKKWIFLARVERIIQIFKVFFFHIFCCRCCCRLSLHTRSQNRFYLLSLRHVLQLNRKGGEIGGFPRQCRNVVSLAKLCAY